MSEPVGDPIREEEIAAVFHDRFVSKIATLDKHLAQLDPAKVAAQLRRAAARYATDVHAASFNTIHRQSEALKRAAKRLDYAGMAKILSGPGDVLYFLDARSRLLQERASTEEDRRSWVVPLPAELLDLGRQHEALERIWRLLVVGGGWVPGRMRPNGKRSWEFQHQLHSPIPSRSEPRREAERSFVMSLRAIYLEATGRMPPATARRYVEGPFASFVAACLCLVRAPVTENDPDRMGLAVQLINDIDRARRKANIVRDFRRILGPLREADATGAISAVARLLEEGKADVLRAQPGSDIHVQKPMLIDFPEEKTLCFFVAPDCWRTVGVRRYPRARIVRLAELLYAINSPDRGARLRRKGSAAASRPRPHPPTVTA